MEAPRIHFDQWFKRMCETSKEGPQTLHDWHWFLGVLTDPGCIDVMSSNPQTRDAFTTSRAASVYGLQMTQGMIHERGYASQYATLYKFMDSGRQCYNLSEELIQAFERTSLKNVEWDHLNLPYDCFYISLPANTFRMWGGYESGFRDSIGIYVRKALDWEESDIVVSLQAGHFDYSYDDDLYSWIGLSEEGFYEYCDFEDYITATFEADKGYRAPGLHGDLKEEQQEGIRRAVRVALNLVCYLQQPKERIDCLLDQEQENNKKRVDNAHRPRKRLIKQQQAVKRVTRLSTVSIRHVGHRRTVLDINKLQTGHMVAAHWHHYRVGKGRKRLELRWIFQYWKPGADGQGPVDTSRTYEVEGARDG